MSTTDAIEHSPITNNWGSARTKRVDAEHIVIFRGHEGGAYNHHHQIMAHDGVLYASWSNGIQNEDDPSQRMVFATSTDFGDTWSAPRAIAGPRPGTYADQIISGEGIREHGGSLYAYYAVNEYPPEGLVEGADPPQRPSIGKGQWPEDEFWSFDEHTEIVKSDDGGGTWSEPLSTIDGLYPNLRPEPIAGGRLVFPGNLTYWYTDDPVGVFGWTRATLPGVSDDYRDAPGRFQKECRRLGFDHLYCEGSFYQTDDGIIHMMLRTDDDAGLLAVSESADRGVTWSLPKLTSFTDSRCRFHFGRLPDGRFCAVSCPKPHSRRTPLVFATSGDGVSFDRHYVIGDEPSTGPRMSGHHKGGRYGYPAYHVAGETVFVIYSIEKEDIAVCRFPLAALD
jgi:hypothetical protein